MGLKLLYFDFGCIHYRNQFNESGISKIYQFELTDIEQAELDNCDNDIKAIFNKFGGGYTKRLPSFIQLNRNLSRLNNILEKILIQVSPSKEDYIEAKSNFIDHIMPNFYQRPKKEKIK